MLLRRKEGPSLSNAEGAASAAAFRSFLLDVERGILFTPQAEQTCYLLGAKESQRASEHNDIQCSQNDSFRVLQLLLHLYLYIYQCTSKPHSHCRHIHSTSRVRVLTLRFPRPPPLLSSNSARSEMSLQERPEVQRLLGRNRQQAIHRPKRVSDLAPMDARQLHDENPLKVYIPAVYGGIAFELVEVNRSWPVGTNWLSYVAYY